MRDIGASWFETALTAPPHHEDRLRRLRPHDGPADPQQRLPPGDEPLERPRHFRHQAGKALRDIGRRRADRVGGAPDHDAAGLVEFRQASATASVPASRRESRWGRAGVERDQGRKLRVAGHRPQRLVGSPLETVAEEIRDRPRRQRRRHLAAAGPGQKQRGREHRERGRDDRRPPRPSATDAGAADGRDRRSRRSRPAPTSTARRRRRRRRDRDRTGRRSGSRTARARWRRNRRNRAPTDRPAADR